MRLAGNPQCMRNHGYFHLTGLLADLKKQMNFINTSGQTLHKMLQH